MIGVITGDIINSRTAKQPSDYLEVLQSLLPKINAHPKSWEIYRGDSFQVEIKDVENAFWYCVYLKSAIKCIKNIDVRLAIGLGNKDFEAKSVSKSSGSAFIRSGETLENLKKQKIHLGIDTGKKTLDQELNASFQLTLMAMNHWTTNSAEIIKLSIENPDKSQQELGELIGIKQNTVSERQKRAFLDELKNFNLVFQQKVKQLQ